MAETKRWQKITPANPDDKDLGQLRKIDYEGRMVVPNGRSLAGKTYEQIALPNGAFIGLLSGGAFADPKVYGDQRELVASLIMAMEEKKEESNKEKAKWITSSESNQEPLDH